MLQLRLLVDQNLLAIDFHHCEDHLDMRLECYAHRDETARKTIVGTIKNGQFTINTSFTYNMNEYQGIIFVF